MTGRHRASLLIALLAFAVPLALREAGWLQGVEHTASDLRSRWLLRDVPSDIVIVGIDARSLAALKTWPWPRRYHGTVLDRLRVAQARRVFLDIDFSAASNPTDDGLLGDAVDRWRANPVLLASFMQSASGTDPGLQWNTPVGAVRRHGQLASVNLLPGDDSLVRSFRRDWGTGDVRIASAIQQLADTMAPARRTIGHDAPLPIDFSISPSSFTFVSYVDLLRGDVDVDTLKGRTIMVGATAVELGDTLPVPLHSALPGVVLQALAAQTLVSGVPTPLPTPLLYAVLAAWAAACMLLFARGSWRSHLLAAALANCAIAALAVALFARFHVALEIAPLMLALLVAFAGVTFRSLDQQTLRALAYAIGIRRRDALLASIVETSADCIVCVDEHGLIQTANPAAERMFGAGEHPLPGRSIDTLVEGLQGADIVAALDSLHGSLTERMARTLKAQRFPVECSVSRVAFKDERLFTVVVRDITQRHAQARKLEYQAMHDPLTGLPNRAALAQHLQRTLAQCASDGNVALLMLDLCRFKEVNDTLGHGAGDQVLCEIAARFQARVGGRGFLARIGGDEFTLVLDDAREVEALAAALCADMKRPVQVESVGIELGLSIGIASYPQQAGDAITLMKNADVAMYVAKRRGSPYEHYDPRYDEHSVRRLRMVADLRSALEQGQLQLMYQPQVQLRSGRVVSAEALLRWHHPVQGWISPAEFIGIIESTDLIQPVTEWTLREALRQLTAWRAGGFHLRVAVNLSARMLQDVAFPQRLDALLREAGVDPQWLELEITESAMMIDPVRALRVVREIHALGVYVSVDDYGTGFSSLGYLRDLTVHALKLDQSFVRNMREHAGNRTIVESTVKLAHALELEVIAEGVETAWDAEFLTRCGYDYAQGFLYSRAVPAAELERWVRAFEPGEVEVPAQRIA